MSLYVVTLYLFMIDPAGNRIYQAIGIYQTDSACQAAAIRQGFKPMLNSDPASPATKELRFFCGDSRE